MVKRPELVKQNVHVSYAEVAKGKLLKIISVTSCPCSDNDWSYSPKYTWRTEIRNWNQWPTKCREKKFWHKIEIRVVNEYVSAKFFGMKGKCHCANNFQFLEKNFCDFEHILSHNNSEIQSSDMMIWSYMYCFNWDVLFSTQTFKRLHS